MLMTNIVKMGKLQNKAPHVPSSESSQPVSARHNFAPRPPSGAQHDDWPLIQQPSATEVKQQSQLDEVPEAIESGINGDSPVVPGFLHDRKLLEDTSGGADSDHGRYQHPLYHGVDESESEFMCANFFRGL
ncbi:unnamed protein product [Cuscuta epithymum]|uniref:Uncharacterized protein n=1 Tax=Cuscuta epithymum TaxID=186058 RepID=A0AAV0EMZ9_9ASTE|nr:unnamed protein product [Cuscuta epithymum]